MKINPHRVQLFSISEIWGSVKERLIELKVMKDPDVESYGSDSDSTEMEDEFDFKARTRERVETLFNAKRGKDKNEKSIAEIMKRNDLRVVRKAFEKVVEHEEALDAN